MPFCNGMDRDSRFAYMDVGKGREQDAEALSHPKGELTSHVRRNAFAGVTWQNEFENRKTGASLQ